MNFMKLILFFIGVILFNNECFPQNINSISGKIIDSSNKEALIGANVYLSNTLIGSSSDNNGYYKITGIPEGSYILVVSMIGYSPVIQDINIKKGTELHKDFSLVVKPIEMSTVTVSASSTEYKDYLSNLDNYKSIFRRYFLGQTEFSSECKIENEDDITFKKVRGTYIEAKCEKPITVINNALGYKIECQLSHFLCSSSRKESSSEFYPKFSELSPKNEEEKNKWESNRKTAYINSLRRFLICATQNEDLSDKYGLYITQTDRFDIKKVPLSKMLYGKENIVQYDTSSNSYLLKFKGFLYITNLVTKESSGMFLPYGNAAVGKDGYPIDPMSIQVFYDFAKQGLANLLPIDDKDLEF